MTLIKLCSLLFSVLICCVAIYLQISARRGSIFDNSAVLFGQGHWLRPFTRSLATQRNNINRVFSMGSVGSETHFRTIEHFKTDYSPNTITQYESSRTGMRVVVVDQEGPKLNGFFTLATEIHDDSGAPHTLEHLCFLGSRSYKYKGFLDKLATRAYSNTNAWTATDYTAYSLDTAGWAGFRQILPIYLEHIILPTLSDAGCLTEVHHIDGTGNDAGVVYSEMQGIQNTPSGLVDLRAKRIIYPEGVGFRYETGGMLEQLRVLTAERIRDFHRDMYQPKNLCLILFGELNHGELLETLDDFETSIMDHIPSLDAPFRRPWIESKQIPPLEKTIVETVEFPEEDESFGQIDIRFLGPDTNNYLEVGALAVVLLYLAGSPAAVLDNTLVEKEQLASGVYYATESRPRTEISFSLSGVETAKLEQVEKRFFDVLRGAMSKDLDMKFMQDCLDSQVRTIKFNAEATSTSFADAIIADYLFGQRDGSTLADIKSLNPYVEVLSKWTQEEWKSFIKKYLSDAHHVSILGVPSVKLSEKLKKEEAERLEQQKKLLGPDGLKRKAEELEEAKLENDREVPSELLSKFKVPPTDSIHFINTDSARLGGALRMGRPNNKYQQLMEHDDENLPLFIDFEQIDSNFIRIDLMLSTETIPLDLRPLLSIYMEAFFNVPIEREGKIINFEQVVTELERDTVGYGIDLADGLGNIECVKISFQVEVDKYDVAINWLKELLWHLRFDKERLDAVNARLLADIPDSKRSGDSMLTACHLMLHLAPESVGRAKSTLTKALYLKRIKKLMKTEPQRIISLLETFSEHLCRFENMRLLVIGDLNKIKHPVSAWKPFLEDLDTSKPLTPLGSRLDRLSDAGKNLGKNSYVVPIPAIDSSYAMAIAKGPTTYVDPKLPALMVAIAYMNSVEGPLWVAVRGPGLAYGTSMSYDITAGYIYLDVYRSPDAYKAFKASQKVIESYMNGDIEFDPLMLEGAISSIVVSFANEQQTLASAARANFVRTIIRGLPDDYMQKMLEKVRAITVPEIKAALREIVYPMFQAGKSDILVTCAPGLKDTIREGLQSDGFDAEIRDLNWFQDDYDLKYEGPDDSDENEDDEDDEDEDGEEDGEGDDDDDGYEIIN